MADENSAKGWLGISARFDSLINTLSNLGGSTDRTTQTRVSGTEQLSEIELEVLYRTNHYAARVIDLVPNEATRRGFTVVIEDSDEDAGADFEEALRQLGAVQKFNQADKWARLYGGAAVIIGLDDGKDTSEPVDWEVLDAGGQVARSLDFLHVVDRYALTPGRIDSDPRSPHFGLPESYTLQFRDHASFAANERASGEIGLDYGQRIHASRMVRFFGTSLPPNLRSEEDWWGDSIIQRVYESLANLGMMERAIGNIGQTFTQAVFKMKGLRNLVKSRDAENVLLDRFTAMNLSQSVLSMMVIDADGEEYEKRTTNVAGLEKLYDRIAQSFASAAEMPLTLVFGHAPSGLSTDDKSGTRNFENSVRADQEEKYIPGLTYICRLLAASASGPSASGAIKVDARPLREPTEAESADTGKKWAEFSAILIDRGVLRPAEVRESFFGGAGFSSDITITAAPDGGEMSDEDALALAAAQINAAKGVDPTQKPEPEEVDPDGEPREQRTVEADPDEKPEEDEEVDPNEKRDGIPHLTKRDVLYVDADAAGRPDETCDRCAWSNGKGECSLVAGVLYEDSTCVAWGTRRAFHEGSESSLQMHPRLDSFDGASRGTRLMAARRNWTDEQRSQWVDIYNSIHERLDGRGLSLHDAEIQAEGQATAIVTRGA